ncbi:hypothetical protein EJ04DRAFT_577935 [Polyplosphaeria fusca]|uniref:Uncharacterized protein n=1 Tax=Polyplosphaeria fusca TaxID=682080 RepID=A0A9P4V1F7_9PLEO|nr:hypothetical protein EJ04DRAFT_577935 [Polyplosphaeria fusca]
MARIGDAIARDRLLHIAIVMQAEIIKSLQLAVKYEAAKLNLSILHETSILTRKDCIVTLDEMKQRILLSRPIQRTLGGGSEDSKDPRASIGSAETFRTAQLAPVPDEYIPKAVTLPATDDSRELKTGLARYFSMKRNSSQSSSSSSSHRSSSSSTSTNTSFSPALNYLLQGADNRGSIMKDIDDIIASYQGLHVDDDSRDPWASQAAAGYGSKRDTLDILNGGYRRDTMGLNREAMQMLRNLPPTPEEAHGNTEYPAVNHNLFDPSAHYFAAPNPLPQRQMLQSSRWSATSASSSVYSDQIPPSLYSNDSRTPNESPTPPLEPDFSPISSNASPVLPWAMPQRSRTPPAPPVAPFATAGHRRQFSAPLTQLSTPHAPFSAADVPQSPIRDEHGELRVNRTRVHLVPGQTSANLAPPIPIPNTMASSSNASRGLAKSLPAPPAPPSIGSSSTATAPSIRNNTIQGPTAAQEKMMDGRPCKDNNYWGFCKGAWAVREEVKKGLSIQTRPDGMYNSHQVWQCRHCNFEGPTFTAPHPHKPKKKETIVNPNVFVSAVGIRYRWMFLAKSHVRKRDLAGARIGPAGKVAEKEDCNYGCVVCSVEGNVTGIYGNVETLMNHVFLEHAGGMGDKVAWKCKAVVGRVAGADEEWDINIPSLGGL